MKEKEECGFSKRDANMFGENLLNLEMKMETLLEEKVFVVNVAKKL